MTVSSKDHHDETAEGSNDMSSVHDSNNKDSPITHNQTNGNSSTAMSDDEFCAFMEGQLQQHPLSKDYPDIFAKAPQCMTQWRRRFQDNPPLWRRLFDRDRVTKEFIEAVPVLDAVVRLIESQTTTSGTTTEKKYTIVDLCSGKGYLSMLLSELLTPSKVSRIVLMDKAFPMRNQQPQSHHINWEHIYGDRPTIVNKQQQEKEKETNIKGTTSTSSTYYETWPISLDTSKQDLKASRQLANIPHHYFSTEHPAIILAIHLCGTLSLRAVQLFNDNPDTVHFLALKPCCLPGMVHVKRHEIFRLGHHSFDSNEVCIHGKWKQNKWVGGPPRSHLQDKFQVWSNHLYCGIVETDDKNDDCGGGGNAKPTKEEDDDENAPAAPDRSGRKIHCRIMVQQGGGFQNDFLFAQRHPTTDTVWEHLKRYQVQDTEPTGTKNTESLSKA
ncbi:methyltransferase domain containing protein [Nitzschia inconspicua]|uniref:Methyltransferase domain containing protein n=1 Tax=Nitzschia inconspicua TaxID=303405 RepID=A0A9K3KIX5_9STRA|nr:methyltransferase domain containing protein [Nitzschia inconspicua]